MPVSPTPAQAEASRRNGARSLGPTTPEGKARAALNGTRHGLRGSTFALLPDEDPAEWAAVVAGYLARFRPADAAELRCVERLAACDWREGRLLRLEAETLFAARGDTSEPDPRLGWSRTLPRYAAAIRRDRKEALEQLEMLRASRPRLPADPTAADAARFRWLAERIERQRRRRATRPNPSPRRSRQPPPGARPGTMSHTNPSRRLRPTSSRKREPSLSRPRPAAEPRATPPPCRRSPEGAACDGCCRRPGLPAVARGSAYVMTLGASLPVRSLIPASSSAIRIRSARAPCVSWSWRASSGS